MELRSPAFSELRSHRQFIVLWGDPGTGKSFAAREYDPGAFWKQPSKWWCGYDGQGTVVLDDFYGWLTPDTVCRLADIYPLTVERKGGQCDFMAHTLIATSNKHWDNWWHDEIIEKQRGAIKRRITLCLNFIGFYPDSIVTVCNCFNKN